MRTSPPPIIALLVLLSTTPLASASAAPSAPSQPAQVARSHVEQGPVRLTVEVAPRDARLSDDLELTLTIDSAPGVTIDKPPFADALGEFQVAPLPEPLLETRGDREIVRQIYQLEPTHAGTFTIPPIAVNYTDATGPQVIESEPLTVTITTSLADDATDLTALQPLAEPLGLEPASNAWLWALPLVVLALLGLWFWRRRRTPALQNTAIPHLSPRDRAAAALQKLVESGLAERDVKLFFVELTGLVRRYIEDTTTIRAPEQTTEEFLQAISGSTTFSPDAQLRLRGFLEAADLVKFAARRPRREDIDESIERARDFLGLATRQEVAA